MQNSKILGIGRVHVWRIFFFLNPLIFAFCLILDVYIVKRLH